MKYLVTSATGDLAGQAVNQLVNLVDLEDIVVTARSLDQAENFIRVGIEVRQADYNDKGSLVKAFKDIDRVLFISSGDLSDRVQQHLNVVDAAKEAGVAFIAYTSGPNIQDSTIGLAPDHVATENAIKDSGIDYTFLRNNWYLENETASIKGAKDGRPFTYSASEGEVGWALKADYAEAAARVIAGVAPRQAIYELGGPLITYFDLAEKVNAVLDKPVDIRQLSDYDYKHELTASGLPETVTDAIVAIQADIRNDELAVESDDLKNVLDRDPAPLEVGIKAILNID